MSGAADDAARRAAVRFGFAFADPELLKTALTHGSAKLEGTYPPVPPAVAFAFAYSGKLEATGALVQFGIPLQGSDDVIVRRTLEGSSEVVYDEVTNPLVWVSTSALVTGP